MKPKTVNVIPVNIETENYENKFVLNITGFYGEIYEKKGKRIKLNIHFVGYGWLMSLIRIIFKLINLEIKIKQDLKQNMIEHIKTI